MQDKLAILLIGKQNSGKTTTLKFFCNAYYRKKTTTFKSGWRYSMYPFHPKYDGVRINGYFLVSSPTEKHKQIKKTIDKLDWMPEFLFMAEQLNGSNYQNTIDFLRSNNYHIKEFILSNNDADSIWNFYDKKTKPFCKHIELRQLLTM